MKWNKLDDKFPPLKPVRNATGEYIGEATDFCLVYGDESLTVDYYVRWDTAFKKRNPDEKLDDGWANAKFSVSHWAKVSKPND